MYDAHPESQCQNELAAAAAEARAAAHALRRGISPGHPDWSPAEEVAYNQRFERWRRASKEIVAALDRLEAEQRHRLRRIR
jgi:uncharacterized protein YukE